MKVLVTGVGGQLGYDVMNELKKRGYEAVGCDITDGVDIALDITDNAAVSNVVSEVSPDVIIHCAAWTAVDVAEDEENIPKVYAVNVDGTKILQKPVKKLAAR